jgi:hypothetical protein
MVYNMMDAEVKGLKIEYFPIDKYVTHLSGASWTEPRTIWPNDHGVHIRPFLTFITTLSEQLTLLNAQTDKDFDCTTYGNFITDKVIFHAAPDTEISITNYFYDLRFKVQGEYVCILNENIKAIYVDFVRDVKLKVIENQACDEMNVGGLVIVSRKWFQQVTCLQ